MKFGTSGLRGLVSEMTDVACARYVRAFLATAARRDLRHELLVGRDLRPSSPRIARACLAAASEVGFRAVDCGVLPTPALALEAGRRGSAAIVVTGSHIPFDRNGLKFYLQDGEITKPDEAEILAHLTSARPLAVGADPKSETGTVGRYTARYVDFFGAGRLAPLRVGVYQHSAAGRDVLCDVMRQLGAEVISLGRTDDFVAIDTEAIDAATAGVISAWVAEHRLDALVSTDGDGDRPMLADEAGTVLRGDVIGILAAHVLGADAVSAPINVSSALERSGWFACVRRTRIGSPYVIEAIAADVAEGADRAVGFEANGGFLLGSAIESPWSRLAALPTRDALLPICAIIAEAADRGIALSSLAGSLPRRATASDRLPDVDPEDCAALLLALAADHRAQSRFIAAIADSAVDQVDLVDGVRLTLASGDVVHLRASGNAPELRCYGESGTSDEAERLVGRALRLAEKALAERRHSA